MLNTNGTCNSCQGAGRRLYPNSGTYMSQPGDGRIVMHAFTADICDKCWGSGDPERPFTNLRDIRKENESLKSKKHKPTTAPR